MGRYGYVALIIAIIMTGVVLALDAFIAPWLRDLWNRGIFYDVVVLVTATLIGVLIALFARWLGAMIGRYY